MAANFDPKSFSRNEWGILGGVLVAFIGLFLRSYGASYTIAGHHYSAGVSGWHFLGLWFPAFILGGLAAAVVVIRALRADLIPPLPVGPRLIVGTLLILAIVIEVIRALTYPSASGFGGSIGASYGTWIVCIATAVAAAFAVIDFKESGEALPTLPAKPNTTTTPTDAS
jgi:hypothetical protein